MNNETVTLIERPYQEIVDDILTAIVGGVVNEPLVFDLKVDRYPLAERAREVRKITGTATVTVNSDQQTFTYYNFQKEIDFNFSEDDNAVIWQEGGTWPDDETTFHVDYFRRESRSPLTDINVGSVTRTLGEAIGREIATVYQQINQAYLSAFVDTAKGKSLDLVVAILGIERLTKDYAVGQVTFFRDPAVKGNIAITEGTVLTTTKGDASFRTAQLRTLQQGQVRINVPIRASNEFKGEAGEVDPGTITELARSIAGIERVTNFEATARGAEDETDEELRARAKAALQALGKGTLAALKKAIADNRANQREVWDPNGPVDKQAPPGVVRLLVESEPEYFPGLQGAVEKARAAGVQAVLVAPYVYFKPRIILQIGPDLPPAGKVKVIQAVIAALQAYVDGLSSGDPADGKTLLETIQGADDNVIKDGTKIVDVIAWRADVGQPGAAPLVKAILKAIQGIAPDNEEKLRPAITTAMSATIEEVLTAIQGAAPDDEKALRQEISDVVTNAASSQGPAAQRIPDRSLVQGPDGQRATPEQIEQGNFQVVATVDDEKWWVVLDIEPADIVLKEEET